MGSTRSKMALSRNWLWFMALVPTVLATSCTVSSPALCSCSELISKHLIKDFNDCTQEAAIQACSDGACKHDDLIHATTVACQEMFTKPSCTGNGRRLLGGGGGGSGCTWCTSTDGAHAECFSTASAKQLDTSWRCGASIVKSRSTVVVTLRKEWLVNNSTTSH